MSSSGLPVRVARLADPEMSPDEPTAVIDGVKAKPGDVVIAMGGLGIFVSAGVPLSTWTPASWGSGAYIMEGRSHGETVLMHMGDRWREMPGDFDIDHRTIRRLGLHHRPNRLRARVGKRLYHARFAAKAGLSSLSRLDRTYFPLGLLFLGLYIATVVVAIWGTFGEGATSTLSSLLLLLLIQVLTWGTHILRRATPKCCQDGCKQRVVNLRTMLCRDHEFDSIKEQVIDLLNSEKFKNPPI